MWESWTELRAGSACVSLLFSPTVELFMTIFPLSYNLLPLQGPIFHSTAYFLLNCWGRNSAKMHPETGKLRTSISGHDKVTGSRLIFPPWATRKPNRRICETTVFRHWITGSVRMWSLEKGDKQGEQGKLYNHLGFLPGGTFQISVQGDRSQAEHSNLAELKRQKS